ncbi:RagB/SusD family nutrient uptake outer membrane protein [Chitinophaga pollutisoli]|uniref:RagB/SusD family nutrient uptake outer membrane protein n=1 Tax=Chitinophaga pollutisoli TaxID=3133966 RepID=A0ABZ2YUA3_9BACT
MKKKHILISGLTACFALSSACNKVLETEPFDRISEDVVWSNKANAETFIFGTYNIMDNFGSVPGTDTRTTNILGQDGTAGGAFPVYTEAVTRNDDYGFNNWGSIRRCNLIIQKVGEAPGISDADKRMLIAEAKFLRAMSYYAIARSTGRIVWIDKVLTPDDELKLPTTANPAASYQYIIKDLEDAVQDMSAEKVSGRANKYVAAAFLSEVCLQAAAYQNYPNAANVTPASPLVDKAIANARFVIDNGGYSLEADYGGMFNETKNTSPEIIYAKYLLPINTSVENTPMQFMAGNIKPDKLEQIGGYPAMNVPDIFNCWPGSFPSENFTDEYLVKDDQNPSLALPWYETSQYKSAVDEMANVRTTYRRRGLPDDSIPLLLDETLVKQGRIKAGSNETVWTLTNRGRDARWASSIVSDSTRFYGELMITAVKGNATRWISVNGGIWGASISNMYWRKGMYTNVTPTLMNVSKTAYHYVCMRLGRVYLNLAEAYLLKGDVANAVASLNKTRETHGKLPPAAAGSLADAWKDYKRERRVDLVLENDYYFSLLRWGRYGGAANNGIAPGGTINDLTATIRVMDITRDRKGFAIVTGAFANAYNQRRFDPGRRYLFPIAQNYIDNNPNFGPQNFGW